MNILELKEKLSPIRSLVETIREEAKALWETEKDDDKSEELDDFIGSLEEIEDLIAELEI